MRKSRRSQPVRPDRKGSREFKVLKGWKEFKVPKAKQVLKENREFKVPKAKQVLKGNKGRRGIPAMPSSAQSTAS